MKRKRQLSEEKISDCTYTNAAAAQETILAFLAEREYLKDYLSVREEVGGVPDVTIFSRLRFMPLEGSVGGEVEVQFGGHTGKIDVKISSPDSPDGVVLEFREPDGEMLFRLTPETDLSALTKEQRALLVLSEPILESGEAAYAVGQSEAPFYSKGVEVARELGGTLGIGRNEEITVEVDGGVARGLGSLFSRR